VNSRWKCRTLFENGGVRVVGCTNLSIASRRSRPAQSPASRDQQLPSGRNAASSGVAGPV